MQNSVEDETETVFENAASPPTTIEPSFAPGESRIVELLGVSPTGVWLVADTSLSDKSQRATYECDSVISMDVSLLGRRAIALQPSNAARPVVTGVLAPLAESDSPTLAIIVDGERALISAEREIVLACGEASITLTRAGKILIRGTYVSSRSSGLNTIKGGSVSIN